MRFIGVEVEQERSAPLLKKIMDPPLQDIGNVLPVKHTFKSTSHTHKPIQIRKLVCGIEYSGIYFAIT